MRPREIDTPLMFFADAVPVEVIRLALELTAQAGTLSLVERTWWWVLLLLAGCTGNDGQAGSPAVAPQSDRPRQPSPAERARAAEIEHDVALTLTRNGPAGVRAGDDWGLKASLVNRSRDKAHWVVKVGDGSEEGSREPTFKLDVQMRDSAGDYRDMSEQQLLRCGLYDSAWDRDGVLLGPGASLNLGWMTPPDVLYEFTRAGRVRVVAHYRYEGGQKGSFNPDSGERRPLPPELAALPPFELVSRPLEVDYQADETFEIKTTALAPLTSGRKTPLDSVLRVTIKNRTVSSVPLKGVMELGADPYDDDWGAFPDELEGPAELGPLASAELHPKRSVADDVLLRARPGKVKLRLVYSFLRRRPDGSEGSVQVYSDWTDLEVR